MKTSPQRLEGVLLGFLNLGSVSELTISMSSDLALKVLCVYKYTKVAVAM